MVVTTPAPTPAAHAHERGAAVKKLETVEMGRGIAACAVVAFHVNATAGYIGLANSPLMSPFQTGVDFFFVLSGFIIFHVHAKDFGKPQLAVPYLWKRFVRLMPLLWLVAIGWIGLRSAAGMVPDADAIGTSLLLYPSMAEPIPVVIWTLRFEILFYLAFCVAIISRRAGLALFGVWTLAVLGQMVLVAMGRPVTGVASQILSSFVLDFLFGAVIALMIDRWRVRSWWPLIAGIVAVLLGALATIHFELDRLSTLDFTSPSTLFVPVIGLTYALLLYGLLCAEDMIKVPRWAMLLGGASYAIYLVHLPVNSFSQHVAVRLGEGIGHLLIFAAGIVAGVILHLMIERPVTRKLRGVISPPARPAQEAA